MTEKLLYRATEAAEVLSLSRAKLYELIQRGELRAIKIDGAARISRDELERFVAERSALPQERKEVPARPGGQR